MTIAVKNTDSYQSNHAVFTSQEFSDKFISIIVDQIATNKIDSIKDCEESANDVADKALIISSDFRGALQYLFTNVLTDNQLKDILCHHNPVSQILTDTDNERVRMNYISRLSGQITDNSPKIHSDSQCDISSLYENNVRNEDSIKNLKNSIRIISKISHDDLVKSFALDVLNERASTTSDALSKSGFINDNESLRKRISSQLMNDIYIGGDDWESIDNGAMNKLAHTIFESRKSADIDMNHVMQLEGKFKERYSHSVDQFRITDSEKELTKSAYIIKDLKFRFCD